MNTTQPTIAMHISFTHSPNLELEASDSTPGSNTDIDVDAYSDQPANKQTPIWSKKKKEREEPVQANRL